MLTLNRKKILMQSTLKDIVSKIKKVLKFSTVIILGFIVAAYSGNAALLYFTSPANERYNEQFTHVDTFGTINILSYENLKSGGLSLGSADASMHFSGYVNLLESEKNIYIDDTWGAVPGFRNYAIYDHELAHILQKEMIAERSGGYPSYANPIRTFKFVKNLLELDSEFSKVMPKPENVNEVGLGIMNLETAADCYSQPAVRLSKVNEGTTLTYVGEQECTRVQEHLALKLINTSEWFNAEKALEEIKREHPEILED